MKRAVALMLTGTLIAQPMQIFNHSNVVSAADEITEITGLEPPFTIPEAKTTARVGASMPYARYDSNEASIGAGAQLKTSTDWNKDNIASQASEQSYVALPSNGSYAEWTVSENGAGSGVTMRFTMPDSADGRGLNGSVDV